jgi:methionine-rich copper-binding protein CopC
MKEVAMNIRRLLLFVICMLTAAPLFAHSHAEVTMPADGEVVQGTPPMIMLHFDKPLRVTSITLKNAQDENQPLTQSDDMKKPVTMYHATPATLAPGRYQVDWRGLSDDGHAMSGRFSFTVE